MIGIIVGNFHCQTVSLLLNLRRPESWYICTLFDFESPSFPEIDFNWFEDAVGAVLDIFASGVSTCCSRCLNSTNSYQINERSCCTQYTEMMS
jgi:hypothetical protein